jgi:[protein-PII] uridylyltransferase
MLSSVATEPPPPDYASAFAATMPASYRQHYDAAAIAAHARLAYERRSAANIGAFHSNRAPGTALCVVADDRPGLLALISAALVTTGIDVIDAEAFTRRTSDGREEAVDVFWVRHADIDQRKLHVTKEEIARLNETMVALLTGKLDAAQVAPRLRAPPTHSALGQYDGTVVRFLEGKDGKLATLEVETSDRSGLLLALSRALYEQRVQIVSSAVRTVDGRVFDRFDVVELDGSSISSGRRLEIQVAVMSAVEPVATPPQPPVQA